MIVNEDKPSLHEWVHEAKKTHSDEVIIAKLKTAGWSKEIIDIVMKPLPIVYTQPVAPPAVNSLDIGVDTLRMDQPVVMQVIPKYADVTLPTNSNTIDLGDRVVNVVLEMTVPRVVVVDNFLSDQECDDLIAASQEGIYRSTVIQNGTGGNVVDNVRTSAGMFHSRQSSPLVCTIEDRISRLIEWPVIHGEGMQILRYEKDEKYEHHNDYFNASDPGSATILGTAGQRIASTLIYLNSPAAGGSTNFKDVGLDLKPRKGTLLFFAYPTADYRSKTLHAGMPVVDGVKWVAVKWYRVNPF